MNRRGELDPSVRGSDDDQRLTLVDVIPDGVQRGGTKRGSVTRTDHERPKTPQVTFFLRAMPASQGWSWRLFVRTGASGAPRLVYSANRIFETAKEAVECGRGALATASMAGLAGSEPSVARAG